MLAVVVDGLAAEEPGEDLEALVEYAGPAPVVELLAEAGQLPAAGVETEAEAKTLVELGCDLLQGYLIAKPAAPFADPL